MMKQEIKQVIKKDPRLLSVGYQHKIGGFTLIEMLVVIAVISILTAVVIIGYRDSGKKYALAQESQKLVADIRRAQNMAMSGAKVAGQYYGFGVYAAKNDNFYVLYGDKNGNHTYQPSDDTLITITIINNVRIQYVSFSNHKLDVFFEPPDPTTYLSGDSTHGLSSTVTLEVENTSLTKTITITTAGVVASN